LGATLVVGDIGILDYVIIRSRKAGQ